MAAADRMDARIRTPANPYAPTDLHALLGLKVVERRIQWADVSADTLAQAVAHWTEGGHAITFGCTSDGGALSISLLSGGKPFKLYAATAEEAEALLERVAGLPGA